MRRVLTTLIGAALALAATRATAADAVAGPYAIAALIGDALTIITFRPATGSSLDANARQTVPMDDGSFDQTAVTAASAAVLRMTPGTRTKTLAIRDPQLYAHSEDLIASPERLAELVAPIAAALGPDDGHFLILVTKYRGDARLSTQTGRIGSGKLAGLGFYVDRDRRMHRVDTGETGRGFLAPYAYFAVSLVDLRSGAVLRTQTVAEATTLSTARSGDAMNPWDTLKPDEKVRILQGMIRRGVERTVPALLDAMTGAPG